VVRVPARLSEAALVNAIATVAEAKAQALGDLGIPGTGTCTDATVIRCPRGGPVDGYGGPRSTWGARLARAAYEAVWRGGRGWLADPRPWSSRPGSSRSGPSPPGSSRLGSSRSGSSRSGASPSGASPSGSWPPGPSRSGSSWFGPPLAVEQPELPVGAAPGRSEQGRGIGHTSGMVREDTRPRPRTNPT
jgi:hypothetical protein